MEPALAQRIFVEDFDFEAAEQAEKLAAVESVVEQRVERVELALAFLVVFGVEAVLLLREHSRYQMACNTY